MQRAKLLFPRSLTWPERCLKSQQVLTVNTYSCVITHRGRLISLSILQKRSNNRLSNMVSNLKFKTKVSCASLRKVSVSVWLCVFIWVCVCVCIFGSKSKGTAGTCPFSSQQRLGDTDTMRFRCACSWHAGQRGQAQD